MEGRTWELKPEGGDDKEEPALGTIRKGVFHGPAQPQPSLRKEKTGHFQETVNSRRSKIKRRGYGRAKSWDLTGCSKKKELAQSDKKQLGCHVGGHSHLLL